MTEEFIGHAEEYDAEEGEEERPGAADVPPREDDAEVFGVPGEEHVLESEGTKLLGFKEGSTIEHLAGAWSP